MNSYKTQSDKKKVSLFTYLTSYGDDLWFNTQATIFEGNDKHFYTDKIPVDRDDLLQTIVEFMNIRRINDTMDGCAIDTLCLQLGIEIDRRALNTDDTNPASLYKMEDICFGDRACYMAFHYDENSTIQYKDIMHCYYTLLKHLYSKVGAYEQHCN